MPSSRDGSPPGPLSTPTIGVSTPPPGPSIDGTRHAPGGEVRIRRQVEASLAPLLADETEGTSDPSPAEIPEPVPGGTEPVTKGGNPPSERR
jgi:hypothetical protein